MLAPVAHAKEKLNLKFEQNGSAVVFDPSCPNGVKEPAETEVRHLISRFDGVASAMPGEYQRTLADTTKLKPFIEDLVDDH